MEKENDLGAGAAAVVNDTGSSSTVTASLYTRVRVVVRDLNAEIRGEATKEDYLRRVFNDVTLCVMTETLRAVEEECRKRAKACEAQARGLMQRHPILADQDKLAAAINRQAAEWCADQIETATQTSVSESGSVPSEAQK